MRIFLKGVILFHVINLSRYHLIVNVVTMEFLKEFTILQLQKYLKKPTDMRRWNMKDSTSKIRLLKTGSKPCFSKTLFIFIVKVKAI